VPGDLMIQKNLEETGIWQIYRQAGFTVDVPNCSMCLGIASRKAGKGEVWLSSQNRTFENRMGEGSLAWLASAATVAASALDMQVSDPRPLLERVDREKMDRILQRKRTRPLPEIVTAEPQMHVEPQQGGSREEAAAGATIHARVQRFGDAVDTDAIIPGEFCHLTALEDLGAKCFFYVRPDFVQKSHEGATIVVADEGWGSGSSREQAVWALQGAGIQVVIAKSYAFIHKRNLVNEALPFLVVKDPAFYELANEGTELEVDLATGRVRDVSSGCEFQAERPSPIVQALQGEGGLVPAVKRYGKEVFTALTA
jgi:aconitate hydratase/homoaconitate hydratase